MKQKQHLIEQRKFGKVNFSVSRIGLGLAALGRPGYINLWHAKDLERNYEPLEMEQHTHRMLDQASRLGIRYVDAARSYGLAEAFLSSWLREHTPDEMIIGSKWGYTYTANWKVSAKKHEVKEHSLNVFTRQWNETQQALGRKPHIYHIHSASEESGVLENKAVIDQLWQLKEEGVVVGLSLSGERQSETLAHALDISHNGELLFQSVQITWNMLEQSATPMLKKAHDSGFGIIVKESLANGRLTLRNEDSEFSEKRTLLAQLAEKYNVGIDAIAISYVLHQPWVSVVLSGAATPEQLRSNVDSAKVKLGIEDLDLLPSFQETGGKYWRKRSELTWN